VKCDLYFIFVRISIMKTHAQGESETFFSDRFCFVQKTASYIYKNVSNKLSII